MSKSAKKRKQAEKRRNEMAMLRGASSLLDDEASPMKPLESSPIPEKAMQMARTYHKLISEHNENNSGEKKKSPIENMATNNQGIALLGGSDGLSTKRKQIEFVLPRSNGKVQRYLFDKQARALHKNELPTILEEFTPLESALKSEAKKKESLDDILFPNKRLKLADKFEAVHHADEIKKEEAMNRQNGEDITSHAKIDYPSASHKKKKKRRRSSSLDNTEQEEKPESSSLSQKDGLCNRRLSSESKKSRNSGQLCHSSAGSAGVHDAVQTKSDMVNRQLSGRSVEQAVQDKQGLRPRANSTDGELNLPQRGLCDEQMVLRSHQWLDQHIHIPHVIPRGLVNLGNTCFLNSILQCLAYSPPFCQSLITISEMKMQQTQNGTKPKQNQGQRITSSLSTLFQKVHGFPGNSNHAGSIAPHNIVKALPSLGSIGSRNGYKFWPGRQEDAHEFLVHLLDAMHDGELHAAGINQHMSGWRDRLPVTRLDETTFIHRIFGGYFRSQVRCKACGYCSNTYDPFLDLSLEVSKNTSNSILNALGEFTRKETLDANNQWKCSGCKRYVCPTKQLTVFRPPLSLCIQLKRFAFTGGLGGRSSFGGGGWKYGKSSSSQGGRSKITKPIEFPSDLDLPLSDGRSCAYSLTGVVIHVGGNASSGHYTAYVRKPGRTGNSQWYHADDSFVEPVSEKNVLRQKDAYILFYCRKEVKLEFPSPPPRDMSTEEAREFGRARARARADSNAAQDELKSNKKTPSTSDSDPVERTKVDIHPLAEFLNATMSEQFKATMSPDSKMTKAISSPKQSSGSGSSKQDANNTDNAQEQSPLECAEADIIRDDDIGQKRNESDPYAKKGPKLYIASNVKTPSLDEVSADGESGENDSQDDVKQSPGNTIKALCMPSTPVGTPGAKQSPNQFSSQSKVNKKITEDAAPEQSPQPSSPDRDGKVCLPQPLSSESESHESEGENDIRRHRSPLSHDVSLMRKAQSASLSDNDEIQTSKSSYRTSLSKASSPAEKETTNTPSSESESNDSKSEEDIDERKTLHRTPPPQTASPLGKNTPLESSSESESDESEVEVRTEKRNSQAQTPISKGRRGEGGTPKESSSESESSRSDEEDVPDNRKSPLRMPLSKVSSAGRKQPPHASQADSNSHEGEREDDIGDKETHHGKLLSHAASPGGNNTLNEYWSKSESEESDEEDIEKRRSSQRTLLSKVASPGGKNASEKSSSESESELEDGTETRKSAHRTPNAASLERTKTPIPSSLESKSGDSEKKDGSKHRRSMSGTPLSKAAKPNTSMLESKSGDSDGEENIEKRRSPYRTLRLKASSPAEKETTNTPSSESESNDSKSEEDIDERKTLHRTPPPQTASPLGKNTPLESSSESESDESEVDVRTEKRNSQAQTPISKGRRGEGGTPKESSSESESSRSDEEDVPDNRKSPLRMPLSKISSHGGQETRIKSSTEHISTMKSTFRKVDSAEGKSQEGSCEDYMEDEDYAKKARIQPLSPKVEILMKPKPDGKPGDRTRVVVGNADSRGKVKVLLGPRNRKAWEPKVASVPQKGSAFQLLGNLGVSKWNDDEDKIAGRASQTAPADVERDVIVRKMEREEKSRKRKMHLDRWDALLDQGKTKKVKKDQESAHTNNEDDPKKNVFQRIQSGIQRMNKGKAKGLFRRKSSEGSVLSNGRRGLRY